MSEKKEAELRVLVVMCIVTLATFGTLVEAYKLLF
jgi:hypothetical protein